MFSSKQIFQINGDSKEYLKKTLNFIFDFMNTSAPSGYYENGDNFILSFSDYDNSVKYQFKMNTTMLSEQIYNWLENDKLYYGEEEEIDGNSYKGWRIEVDNQYITSRLIIYPCWIYYHK